MDEERGGSILIKLAIIGFVCVIYLLYVVAVHVCGPTMKLKEHVEEAFGGGVSVKEAGASQVAEVIRSDGGSMGHGKVLGFDENTVLRVLDAVDEYNRNASAERTVPYEYMHYVGMLDAYDPETGDATVSDWVTEEEVTEVIGTKSVVVGTEKVYTEYTQEEIDEMAREYFKRFPTGTFMPPPSYYFVPIYEEQEITETHVEIVTHRAVTETLTDQVTLSRTAVEGEPELGGENVFELDWRPVLTVCAMIAQRRTEEDGTLTELENGAYLTDEEILDVINFFGYQYSYVDDGTAEDYWDPTFGRGSGRNAAYRLVVSGDAKVGEVCELTVRRVPQVAPKLIANAYLTYEYEYSEKENGEWVLVARNVRVDGESFLMGLDEIVGGFDSDRFAVMLREIADDDVANRFKALGGGQLIDERTEDPAVCPCIGTTVTKGAGWSLSHSSLFFVGRTAEGGDLRPFGATVTSIDFTPAPEAMEDETFAKIYETAAACVGTKYVFGGNGGPGVSFDCSSFVAYVFKECGYPVNGYPNGRETTVSLLGTKVTRISEEELKPGDVLFFKGTIKDRGANAVSHVAIWLGEGMIVHASGRAGQVTAENVFENSYLQEHFMCYARMNK